MTVLHVYRAPSGLWYRIPCPARLYHWLLISELGAHPHTKYSVNGEGLASFVPRQAASVAGRAGAGYIDALHR